MEYRASQNGETLIIEDTKHQLKVKANARTDMGMVRSNNEDNAQIWVMGQIMIGMVADGMGGAAGGEFASRIAVDSIQSVLLDSAHIANQTVTEAGLSDTLRAALNTAHESVLAKAAEDHQLHGMGTTTTLVILEGTQAVFAHIGDSRAYVVDGITRRVNQISRDHSYVEALVISGHLTREQAEVHPMKNVLYRALGQKPDTELEVDIYSATLKEGDRVVLCSDGLPRHVNDREIGEICLKSDDPAEITQNLINLAKERGGEDNISAILLLVDQL